MKVSSMRGVGLRDGDVYAIEAEGHTYFLHTIPDYKYSVIIALNDPEQLWGELLAFAGMPPDDNDQRLLPWIQEVLKALSEIHPDSGARQRLDIMVKFSDYCKEKQVLHTCVRGD